MTQIAFRHSLSCPPCPLSKVPNKKPPKGEMTHVVRWQYCHRTQSLLLALPAEQGPKQTATKSRCSYLCLHTTPPIASLGTLSLAAPSCTSFIWMIVVAEMPPLHHL